MERPRERPDCGRTSKGDCTAGTRTDESRFRRFQDPVRQARAATLRCRLRLLAGPLDAFPETKFAHAIRRGWKMRKPLEDDARLPPRTQRPFDPRSRTVAARAKASVPGRALRSTGRGH